MARAAERVGLSPDEYLAWEREQPVRHEYFRGEVFAMAGEVGGFVEFGAFGP